MMYPKAFGELFFKELDKYEENLHKIFPNMNKVYSGLHANAEMANAFDENLYKQYEMLIEFNHMCTMMGVDKF